MGDANSGLEQVRRREAVTKLEEEVAQAVSYEQLQQAAKSIQEAMAAMPTEARSVPAECAGRTPDQGV